MVTLYERLSQCSRADAYNVGLRNGKLYPASPLEIRLAKRSIQNSQKSDPIRAYWIGFLRGTANRNS